MTITPAKSLLSCAIIATLLSACGGGGGGGSSNPAGSPGSPNSSAPTATSTPGAPTVALDFAVKKLRFSWNAVSGATFYRVLEDAAGTGSYVPISGDLAGTGFDQDIAVHAQNWGAARYRVQACNSAGCATADAPGIGLDKALATIGYFKASNTGSGDAYGWALALSGDGNTLAVGAPFEDSSASGVNGNQLDENSLDSGAVYIFVKAAGGWVQQAYLKAPNNVAGANFGESLALSGNGDTLAVGAPFENGAAATVNGDPDAQTAADAGAVYVFTRSGGSWGQSAYIKPSNNYAENFFGWSVALSADGDTLAAGAPGDSSSATGINPAAADHGSANAGAAYIFKRGGSGWSQQAYLKASNTDAEDNFGIAVALSGAGTALAVGAPYESGNASAQSDNSAANAGAVYVFAFGASWSQQAYLKASNADAQDNFGAALALDGSGNTLAVGAPYESSSASGVGGSQGNNSATDAGAAYVFSRSGASWSQQAYVKASNTDTNDDFGSAVALSGDGNTLVIGAIGESSRATGVGAAGTDNSLDGVGAAYLYNRSGASWAQKAYLKPSTATLGDEFGSALGLSSDAATLAISGAFEQSNGSSPADTSATDAGAVWLF